jgi:hypothetical protein
MTPSSNLGGGNSSPANRSSRHVKPRERRARIVRVLSWAAVAIGFFAGTFFGKLGDQAETLVTSLGSPAGPPIRIVLVDVANQSSSANVYVFRQPRKLTPRQLASLNVLDQSAPSYANWFSSRGAIDVSPIGIQLVVEGNRARPVRIVGLQPVLDCHAPPHGTAFETIPPGTAGPPTGVSQASGQVSLDLDQARPELVISGSAASSSPVVNEPAAGANAGTTPAPAAAGAASTAGAGNISYFQRYTVPLSEDQQFTFQITVGTQQHDCQFTLLMTVLQDNGVTTTEKISDHQKEFEVTGTSTQPYAVTYTDFGNTSVNAYGNPTWSLLNPPAR